MWKDLKLPDGRDRIVRHGHGPHRAIQTGVGPVEVRRAKVRDRGDVGAEEKIRFTSSILPKWARRTKSLDALLPVLYLRGVSTGDFQEALAALLGKDAPNLSPAVISRLTAKWQADYDAWQKRDLSARRYVYVWADGVYLQARMEASRRMHAGAARAPRRRARRSSSASRPGCARARRAGASCSVDHQAPRPGDPARPRRRRRRARLLEGDRGRSFPVFLHQRCWGTPNAEIGRPLSVQVNMNAGTQSGAQPRPAKSPRVFAEKAAGAKYEKAVTCLT